MIHFMLYTTGKQTIVSQPVLIAIEIVVIDTDSLRAGDFSPVSVETINILPRNSIHRKAGE